jgi:hypothetical protein
MKMEERTP